MQWWEFVEKLKTPRRTEESLEEFIRMPAGKQVELKDVGGFVGGRIEGSQRKSNKVIGRDLIALDLDNIPAGKTDDVVKRVEGLGCAYALYSTRKHAEYAPRLRILFPLNNTVNADEYEPTTRKICSMIGMEFADPTTFEVARLMFWPSVSRDSTYVFKVGDKPFLDAASVLASYVDWHDVTSWPQVPGHLINQARLVAKQQDPETKSGVVGAFCRSYNIFQAMDTFIPKAYEATAEANRFTYIGGTTFGGAVVYDDKFLYSYHASDPCSGKLVNAFDLVRLHLFGDADKEIRENTPPGKVPSYKAMRKLALEDKHVTALINKEKREQVEEAFQSTNTSMDSVAKQVKDDLEWMSKLSRNTNTGSIEKTINNIILILENAVDVKGKIALDEFANRGMVLGELPWNRDKNKRLWTDVDDAEISRYLETGFGITGQDKIDKALLIVSSRHKFNAVKNYLESLVWDGIRRIDTLLCDYLGAEQNVYTADVMRKSLAAAVSRAVQGATKYDFMPIISGPQGIGKSTFLYKLGRKWFSDSLQTFEGKEAAEMIQGVWINEIGELTSMTKSETDTIKQFLSKQDDIYREAYGKRTNKYPRRCVFFGTTNNQEFLKDVTGNRRFWPVDVGILEPTKNIFTDLDNELDQIWAEAYMLWTLGEPLFLTGKSLELAEEMQSLHREGNALEGMILDFLEIKVPENWNSMTLDTRRMFLSGNLPSSGLTLVARKKVCALEIWCECLLNTPGRITKRDTREINAILDNLPGWQRNKDKRRFGYCGSQRGYEKVWQPVKNKCKIIQINV